VAEALVGVAKPLAHRRQELESRARVLLQELFQVAAVEP